MKSRKDQVRSGRRICSGNKCDSVAIPSRLCFLCPPSFFCILLLLLLMACHHNFKLHPEFLAKKSIDARCMSLCNSDVARFAKSGGTGGLSHFLASGEKFMYYSPHSGFNNQVVELKNALMFALILNRTLIVPPVLDHHAAWLGSCPKRRVFKPHRLRALVWRRILDLIANSSSGSRYTSIADIVDISSITPSKVKTIDLRLFLASWCGVDIATSCGGPFCKTFAPKMFLRSEFITTPWVENLNPLPTPPSSEFNCCVHGVEDDCTSTIWTYHPNFLRNETTELQNEDLPNPPHTQRTVRVRAPSAERNSHENGSPRQLVDVRTSLGSNSSAGMASVLAFGSMFTMIYKDVQSHINITAPSGDQDLDDLIQSLQLLSFSPEILAAGKTFLDEEIGRPDYFCAQLRLSDGQFKNHRNATFRELEAQLTAAHKAPWSTNSQTPVFVMTDLPNDNNTTTEIGNLFRSSANSSSFSYQVHTVHSRNDLIETASRKILASEAGFFVGCNISGAERGLPNQKEQSPGPGKLQIPHVELAIEEVVCSCARLGFFGTRGSTIADRIRELRATNTICNTSLVSAGVQT